MMKSGRKGDLMETESFDKGLPVVCSCISGGITIWLFYRGVTRSWLGMPVSVAIPMYVPMCVPMYVFWVIWTLYPLRGYFIKKRSNKTINDKTRRLTGKMLRIHKVVLIGILSYPIGLLIMYAIIDACKRSSSFCAVILIFLIFFICRYGKAFVEWINLADEEQNTIADEENGQEGMKRMSFMKYSLITIVFTLESLMMVL